MAQLCWLQDLQRWWSVSSKDLPGAITGKVGRMDPADLQKLTKVLRVRPEMES